MKVDWQDYLIFILVLIICAGWVFYVSIQN